MSVVRIGARRPRRTNALGRDYPVALNLALETSIRQDLSSLLSELRADSLLSEPERFKVEYLEREIFSKYLPTCKTGAKEREDAAIKKWLRMEQRNEKTNSRLLVLEAYFKVKRKGVWGLVSSNAILATAASYIRNLLGDSPFVGPSGPSVEILHGTFTSGASTKFSRGVGVIATKFMEEAHVTRDALKWVSLVRKTSETWRVISDDARGAPLDYHIVSGNVMFTVPKTSEIDRCACKEPGLNMYLQKGIGDHLRRRLRSVGIDLSDQTLNQRMAKAGSEGKGLATLDLSSASDTLSNALVYRLLPLDWFMLLDDCRSKVTLVNGEEHELSMFSSMGNAFTFELETLIFWALACACKCHLGVRGPVTVYGDDIIVPNSAAGFIARVFDYVGFKVNPKKSYWSGSFRESCGKHWYAATDVTPVYVREPIAFLPRLIHLLNRLKLWACEEGRIAELIIPFWDKYSSYVPRRLRGGRDLESILQLVSDETPMQKLSPIPKKVDGISEAGLYLQWLRAAGSRVTGTGICVSRYTSRDGVVMAHITFSEAIVTSRLRDQQNRYRLVPAIPKKYRRNGWCTLLVANGTHGQRLL